MSTRRHVPTIILDKMFIVYNKYFMCHEQIWGAEVGRFADKIVDAALNYPASIYMATPN